MTMIPRALKKIIFILLTLTLIGCGKKDTVSVFEASNIQTEEIQLVLPEIARDYRFLYIADLHIIVENDEVSEENTVTVNDRKNLFSSAEGVSGADLWDQYVDVINSYECDAVLLGGDMIDFASRANIEKLREGIEKIKHPVMYVRADHDLMPFYCEGIDETTAKAKHCDIDGNEEIMLLEFDELCVVGINNNTSQISASAVNRVKEIVEIGKPIILVAHVPFKSKVDESLLEKSKEAWQDRNLVWGSECLYWPDANTQQLVDMIHEEDSLFKEVLAGHLHFTWDGMLNEVTHQHVFEEACSNVIGIVHVTNSASN